MTRRRKRGGRYTPPAPPRCPCCSRPMVPAGELPDGWPPEWMSEDDVAQAEALVADGWAIVQRDDETWSLVAPPEYEFG